MGYGLEAVHAELTALLKDVARVLEDNHLPYSVMCGTLLGAVRHGGFIPWDDDVDLALPRESYDRFEALYPAQCAPGFTLDLTDTWVPRVRRQGGDAFIDLFVLDPLPEGKFRRAWKLLRLRALQGMLKEKTDYSRFRPAQRLLLRGTRLLGLPFPRAAKLRAYRRVARGGGPSRFTHMSDGAFNLLSMALPADVLDNPVSAPFEELSVRVPRDAHAMLVRLYGETYGTPPPESERRPLHLDR